MYRLLFPTAVAAACMVLSAAAVAEQSEGAKDGWPRWRGPIANGIAPAGNPPLKWSETENLKWKTKIPGFGTSTPIISGNRIFILTAMPSGQRAEAPAVAAPAASPDDARQQGGRPRRGGGGGGMQSEKPNEAYQFIVLCLDRNTGKGLWQKVAREEVPHEGHHRDHGFASASPVTDGEHVYTYFGSRGLYCYDFEGNLKWEKDFGDMQTRNGFGEGSSPTLHGNTIFITWDHEGDDFIVALDKRTGNELWRQPRNEPTGWSTPLIVEHDGKAQVVVSATERIRSYDVSNGKQLWECAGMTANAIPTPVTGFGKVYAISGFRGAALLAIQLGKTGNLTGTDAIAWQHNKGTPYVPSPLLSGERLYFYSGNNGMLSCFNAQTGKPYYETERIPDLLGGVYASPVGANGRVYLVGRDGKTVVIKDSDKLETLANNKLDDKFDASAAIVGKELFLRGHEYLYCLSE
ncbi:PQQ-binding-like beta-propeller repeat protein [Verrucomicrobiota bacterium sgz303538]